MVVHGVPGGRHVRLAGDDRAVVGVDKTREADLGVADGLGHTVIDDEDAEALTPETASGAG